MSVEETEKAAGDQSPAVTNTRTVDIVVSLILLALAGLWVSTACPSKPDIPTATGPSELGLSLQVLASPDVLNTDGLRFADEFVRHKLVDAIGDLFLAGGAIVGHFRGVRAGHALTRRLLGAMFADPEAWCFTTMFEAVNLSAPVWTSAARAAAA